VNGAAFCGRGACSALLIPVEDCGYCGKRSLSTEDGQCVYPECEVYGLVQQPCPNCGGPALEDPDTGAIECQKPDCAAEEEAPAFDPDTMGGEMTIMDLWASAPETPDTSGEPDPAPASVADDPLMTLPAIEPEEPPSHELPTINAPMSTTEDLDASDVPAEEDHTLLDTSGPDELLVEEPTPPPGSVRDPDEMGVTIL